MPEPTRICVVGGGIVGLGTALYLQLNGYTVTLFTDNKTFNRTSSVAAAFWYPYAVDFDPPELEQQIAEPTFKFLVENACPNPLETGVSLTPGLQYFDQNLPLNQPPEPWWSTSEAIRESTQFRVLDEQQLPSIPDDTELGVITHGWSFRVPVIHAETFLLWLGRQIQEAGGTIVDNHRVDSLNSPELRREYAGIINCTGGWATRLTNSPFLYALQGVVIRIPKAEYNPPDLVFLEHGTCADAPVYIVPHANAPTVLGGTVTPATALGERWHRRDVDKWTPDPADVRTILRRCALIDPALKSFIGRDDLTAVAGLRPRREHRPPRIELDTDLSEPGFKVIHNYGHGGSGFTLFWGSAIEVHHLLRK